MVGRSMHAMNDKFLSVARKAARAGAKELKAFARDGFRVDFKAPRNLVTEADVASQEAVRKVIVQAFPGHNLLMEEDLDSDQGSEFTWVVDPLDGTTNFAHGYPMYAVSVAVAKGREPVAGVVYNVPWGEFFEAVKGKGAFLNGKRIRVSKVAELEYSLLATGFPYKDTLSGVRTVHDIGRLWRKVQGLRRSGSAALDICYVACGRMDAYWEYKLSPWDLAAGQLILREAGGKVTDFFGKPLDAFSREVVASNNHLHAQLLKNLEGAR